MCKGLRQEGISVASHREPGDRGGDEVREAGGLHALGGHLSSPSTLFSSRSTGNHHLSPPSPLRHKDVKTPTALRFLEFEKYSKTFT